MMQLCHQSNSGAWITKGWLCMMMYHVVSCQKKDNTTSTTDYWFFVLRTSAECVVHTLTY